MPKTYQRKYQTCQQNFACKAQNSFIIPFYADSCYPFALLTPMPSDYPDGKCWLENDKMTICYFLRIKINPQSKNNIYQKLILINLKYFISKCT